MWGFPVVLLRNKSGDPRFGIDYRLLTENKPLKYETGDLALRINAETRKRYSSIETLRNPHIRRAAMCNALNKGGEGYRLSVLKRDTANEAILEDALPPTPKVENDVLNPLIEERHKPNSIRRGVYFSVPLVNQIFSPVVEYGNSDSESILADRFHPRGPAVNVSDRSPRLTRECVDTNSTSRIES